MANNQNLPKANDNGGAQDTPQKESVFKRTGDAAFRKWQQFKTSKAGRWVLRIAKGAAVGGLCYFSYEEGKKTAKPTVVYVQAETGEVVQPEAQEPAKEEPEVQAENA